MNDSLFNTKLLEGYLDKSWDIVCLNDYWCVEMFGNNFLCKLANNIKNLSMVFNEINPNHSSILINETI